MTPSWCNHTQDVCIAPTHTTTNNHPWFVPTAYDCALYDLFIHCTSHICINTYYNAPHPLATTELWLRTLKVDLEIVSTLYHLSCKKHSLCTHMCRTIHAWCEIFPVIELMLHHFLWWVWHDKCLAPVAGVTAHFSQHKKVHLGKWLTSDLFHTSKIGEKITSKNKKLLYRLIMSFPVMITTANSSVWL